jgi:hypothetical protein
MSINMANIMVVIDDGGYGGDDGGYGGHDGGYGGCDDGGYGDGHGN